MKSQQKNRSTRLTPNQCAALSAIAEGLTVEEIATDWDVSQTVVYRNIERARAKLGGRTTAHAIAIWVGMQPQLVGQRNAIAVNGAAPAERA